MKKVLIFPAPFLIQKTTADQQNDYMFSLLKDEVALEGIGDFIEVNALNKSDYCEEVRRIIAEQKPNWIIASEESATACIGLYGQKKILVNPIVTFDDLNNVPEYAHYRPLFARAAILQHFERAAYKWAWMSSVAPCQSYTCRHCI